MFKKFHWGHGIALALGVFIIFILSMIFFFPIGKQNSELVSDHYYEDELAYQQTIDAKKNADLLPQKPVYTQNKDGISVAFPELIQPENKKIKFILFRTDDGSLDVSKELQLQNNEILIPAKILVPGSYTLKVSWLKDKKPYQVDYDVLWKQH